MIRAYIGDTVSVTLPYSEACCFLRVAGTRMTVRVQPDGAQLLTADGAPYSFPVTHGEAGIVSLGARPEVSA